MFLVLYPCWLNEALWYSILVWFKHLVLRCLLAVFKIVTSSSDFHTIVKYVHSLLLYFFFSICFCCVLSSLKLLKLNRMKNKWTKIDTHSQSFQQPTFPAYTNHCNRKFCNKMSTCFLWFCIFRYRYDYGYLLERETTVSSLFINLIVCLS